MAQILTAVPLAIPEGDEPLLTFTVDGGGMTGAAVKWVSKATEDVDDSTGVTISGVVVNDTTFTIQVEDTSTGAGVGHRFYKIVVTKSGHPVTWRHGPLVIENV